MTETTTVTGIEVAGDLTKTLAGADPGFHRIFWLLKNNLTSFESAVINVEASLVCCVLYIQNHDSDSSGEAVRQCAAALQPSLPSWDCPALQGQVMHRRIASFFACFVASSF